MFPEYNTILCAATPEIVKCSRRRLRIYKLVKLLEFFYFLFLLCGKNLAFVNREKQITNAVGLLEKQLN